MPLETLTTPAQVRAWVGSHHRQGRTVALVPTMGALHDGHLTLVREGLRRADVAAVSIFVNPTQFGPNEDLARYPRDPDGDRRLCEGAGATAAYLPSVEAVYPKGFQTQVTVREVSQGLCGARRPGHFEGVATVVTKLLATFRPDVALFGEKDFQQLQVIRALNRDLDLGVEIVGVPTVREADGLAMSSRNRYLSADDRRRALSLSKALFGAQAAAAKGERTADVLVGEMRRVLAEAKVREDYVEVVDTETLRPLRVLEPGRSARALIAGFLGQTRLIDNVALDAR